MVVESHGGLRDGNHMGTTWESWWKPHRATQALTVSHHLQVRCHTKKKRGGTTTETTMLATLHYTHFSAFLTIVITKCRNGIHDTMMLSTSSMKCKHHPWNACIRGMWASSRNASIVYMWWWKQHQKVEKCETVAHSVIKFNITTTWDSSWLFVHIVSFSQSAV